MNTVLIDECDIITETYSAILINHEGVDYWIPLSQVNEIHKSPMKHESSIMISEWIARQKGLI